MDLRWTKVSQQFFYSDVLPRWAALVAFLSPPSEAAVEVWEVPASAAPGASGHSTPEIPWRKQEVQLNLLSPTC